MEKIKILVSGIVHGVFFRKFVKERAEELGLTGYTKNTENKEVEVIVEGHELKIKKLVEDCKRGPLGSLVKKVTIKKAPYKGEFKDFKVKY